jgi:hypothetical protein
MNKKNFEKKKRQPESHCAKSSNYIKATCKEMFTTQNIFGMGHSWRTMQKPQCIA